MSEMNGLVDSATVAQVVQCLDRGTTGQYPWSLTTVLDLTAILIRESSMALAPGLGPPKGVALDGQDLLIDLMLSSGLLRSTRQFDQSTRDVAIKRSKRWIARTENSDKVRAEVDRLLADKRDFQPWIDWSSEKAWLSHSRRLGGLFDPNYLQVLRSSLGFRSRMLLNCTGGVLSLKQSSASSSNGIAILTSWSARMWPQQSSEAGTTKKLHENPVFRSLAIRCGVSFPALEQDELHWPRGGVVPRVSATSRRGQPGQPECSTSMLGG